MINFLADGFGQIISMFLSWIGIAEGAAKDITSRSAGGTLTLIVTFALIVAVATFIVTVIVRVASAASMDGLPSMNHVTGHINDGIWQVRKSYWSAFWHGVYLQRAIKRHGVKVKKRKAANQKDADAIAAELVGMLTGQATASGASSGGITEDGEPVAEPAMSNAGLMVTRSGVLVVRGSMELGKRLGSVLMLGGGKGLEAATDRPYIQMSDGMYKHKSGNVYERVQEEEPAPKEKEPEIIETTGQAVGDGEYIGPA